MMSLHVLLLLLLVRVGSDDSRHKKKKKKNKHKKHKHKREHRATDAREHSHSAAVLSPGARALSPATGDSTANNSPVILRERRDSSPEFEVI